MLMISFSGADLYYHDYSCVQEDDGANHLQNALLRNKSKHKQVFSVESYFKRKFMLRLISPIWRLLMFSWSRKHCQAQIFLVSDRRLDVKSASSLQTSANIWRSLEKQCTHICIYRIWSV